MGKDSVRPSGAGNEPKAWRGAGKLGGRPKVGPVGQDGGREKKGQWVLQHP